MNRHGAARHSSYSTKQVTAGDGWQRVRDGQKLVMQESHPATRSLMHVLLKPGTRSPLNPGELGIASLSITLYCLLGIFSTVNARAVELFFDFLRE